nr:MAG TPA: hypothetical protein [Caudoviricetes sp.]
MKVQILITSVLIVKVSYMRVRLYLVETFMLMAVFSIMLLYEIPALLLVKLLQGTLVVAVSLTMVMCLT